jgi:hypothetical protein
MDLTLRLTFGASIQGKGIPAQRKRDEKRKKAA